MSGDNTKTDFLSKESLDWAIEHICRFGDTDIMPVPFEYEIISKRWANLRPYLEEIDLSSYCPKSTFNVMVPKHKGYRAVRQLEPVDNILMVAAVKEILTELECSRADDSVACAYRCDPKSDETYKLYKEDGYKQFHKISKEHAESGEYEFVLCLDIADFYNQIYLHRVHNQLEAANISHVRAKNIENFLITINSKKSIGLPVGPTFSIILAEIVLNDLDFFVEGYDVGYVRYVDDIRIFCRTSVELEKMLHDISEYLYLNLRLSLQGHKTKKLNIDNFISNYLYDPEDDQKESYLKALKAKMEEIGYGATEEDVEDDHGFELESSSLKKVFENCIEDNPYEFGYFKAILRLATKGRQRSILPIVLENLVLLMPVYRDVMNYLLKVENDHWQEEISDSILKIFKRSNKYNDLIFQRIWSCHYLYSEVQSYYHDDQLNYVKKFRFREYMLLMGASQVKYRSHFSLYKEAWQNYSPSERRAIIYASRLLPKTERNIWLSTVASNGDPLERQIALYMKSIE